MSPVESETPRLTRVLLSALADCNLNPTRHAVEFLLPRGHVTLLGSHGGTGKSMLALILAAHVVCGRAWRGLKVSPGLAIFVSLEDPGELVRYRLKQIAETYNLDVEVIANGLLVLDGSTSDSVLVTELSDSGIRRLLPTAAMEELQAAAEGRTFIVIDNASDAFDASENDRRMVRSFARRLAHIARANDASVLLLAHIDKLAARTGSSGNTYSGSTAWHNSSRSRLALIETGGRLELVHEKNNLGRKAASIALAWTDHGVLVPVDVEAAANTDAEDDAAILHAIKVANEGSVNVPTGRVGAATTLSVLQTLLDLPAALRKNRARFWAAISRLERAKLVVRETYKTPSRHIRERLICARSKSPIPPAIQRARGRAESLNARNDDSAQFGAFSAVDERPEVSQTRRGKNNGTRRLWRTADPQNAGDWHVTTLPGTLDEVRENLELQVGHVVEVRNA